MTYPPDLVAADQKLIRAYTAAQLIAGLAPATRGVVQAGGCVGQWPVALATYFAHVYTFEPDATNFAYLTANIASRPNITAFPCAVGDCPAHVGLTRPKPKPGLWRVDGLGDIEMVTIDDAVGDVPIDAIVLDVEGYEIEALRGAERLIEKYRPVLWIEFLHNQSELKDFMAAYGYTRPVPTTIGADAFSVHSSQLARLQTRHHVYTEKESLEWGKSKTRTATVARPRT